MSAALSFSASFLMSASVGVIAALVGLLVATGVAGSGSVGSGSSCGSVRFCTRASNPPMEAQGFIPFFLGMRLAALHGILSLARASLAFSSAGLEAMGEEEVGLAASGACGVSAELGLATSRLLCCSMAAGGDKEMFDGGSATGELCGSALASA